ncbi:hypothetical protein [Thermococcus sp. Bubb.Bath]|uniref:hypothetical protein n=1 Tax=Thermococcus sp. Bubb.Bath TaxID=1638242 RepID=UPI00143A9E86|nr:hypothetical protein [Thermococcus sp. Bubb.Bath]NJF25023.1 hypothetical protein [Thermococcus sp. Bubb.Bath]
MVNAEKIERLVDEIAEEMKNAKSPEELDALEKKVDMLEDLIEAVEGDKDIEKAAQLMDKIGPMMEDIIGPIKDLITELYSPEKMAAMGKSVADFYKNLVEAGMDKETATELTKEYMKSVNAAKSLMEMLQGLIAGRGGHNVNINIPSKPKKVREVEIEEEEGREE